MFLSVGSPFNSFATKPGPRENPKKKSSKIDYFCFSHWNVFCFIHEIAEKFQMQPSKLHHVFSWAVN
jgi:hypothetical protein